MYASVITVDDLGASVCIVMSRAAGHWALMNHESDVVFWRDCGCVALGFTVCVIQVGEQEIVEKIYLCNDL